MEVQKTLTVAYDFSPFRISEIPGNTKDLNVNFIDFLSWSENVGGRIALALEQYLRHTNNIHKINYFPFDKTYNLFRNGMLAGSEGKINVSEIDIWLPRIRMSEDWMPRYDFTYPTNLMDYTFVTRKPKYRPHIFGIFQTFSLPVWITMAFVFVATLLMHHIIFKNKFNFVKILFHVFSVMMKQGSAIAPSSLGEKILVYSWILGCMILCLSYDSVFLSFLSFPPVIKIKHLSDLALAVQKGDIQCISSNRWGAAKYLWDTNEENLKVIQKNLLKNNLRYQFAEQDFVMGKKKNFALFISSDKIHIYQRNFFVSKDRFMISMYALAIRKKLTYKDLLDTFVHRMMASGIYLKYLSDNHFWWSMRYFPQDQNDDTDKRKLTLTDLAPAFIFLLFGWIVSFIVLICEILLNRKNMKQPIRVKEKKKESAF